MLAAFALLVGCSPTPEKQGFSGTALNAHCEGPSCFIVVSGLDGWGIRRSYEWPTCDDNRDATGSKVLAFKRVQDNRICWKIYATD